MPIKAVFFDLYNTLAGFNPPRDVIQARAASKFGLTLTKEGVDAGYLEADAFMAAQNAGRRPVRTMSSPERDAFFARFEQIVLKGCGHDLPLEVTSKIWREVTVQQYGLELFDDVVPVLASLRKSGYKLGVITNMNITGDEVLTRFALAGHVDFASSSRDAGADKPHAPIFVAALKRAGVKPAEAAHVGDQLDADIGGAVGAGLRAVLIDRYNGHRGYTSHPRITGMTELAGVLAAMA